MAETRTYTAPSGTVYQQARDTKSDVWRTTSYTAPPPSTAPTYSGGGSSKSAGLQNTFVPAPAQPTQVQANVTAPPPTPQKVPTVAPVQEPINEQTAPGIYAAMQAGIAPRTIELLAKREGGGIVPSDTSKQALQEYIGIALQYQKNAGIETSRAQMPQQTKSYTPVGIEGQTPLSGAAMINAAAGYANKDPEFLPASATIYTGLPLSKYSNTVLAYSLTEPGTAGGVTKFTKAYYDAIKPVALPEPQISALGGLYAANAAAREGKAQYDYLNAQPGKANFGIGAENWLTGNQPGIMQSIQNKLFGEEKTGLTITLPGINYNEKTAQRNWGQNLLKSTYDVPASYGGQLIDYPTAAVRNLGNIAKDPLKATTGALWAGGQAVVQLPFQAVDLMKGSVSGNPKAIGTVLGFIGMAGLGKALKGKTELTRGKVETKGGMVTQDVSRANIGGETKLTRPLWVDPNNAALPYIELKGKINYAFADRELTIKTVKDITPYSKTGGVMATGKTVRVLGPEPPIGYDYSPKFQPGVKITGIASDVSKPTEAVKFTAIGKGNFGLTPGAMLEVGKTKVNVYTNKFIDLSGTAKGDLITGFLKEGATETPRNLINIKDITFDTKIRTASDVNKLGPYMRQATIPENVRGKIEVGYYEVRDLGKPKPGIEKSPYVIDKPKGPLVVRGYPMNDWAIRPGGKVGMQPPPNEFTPIKFGLGAKVKAATVQETKTQPLQLSKLAFIEQTGMAKYESVYKPGVTLPALPTQLFYPLSTLNIARTATPIGIELTRTAPPISLQLSKTAPQLLLSQTKQPISITTTRPAPQIEITKPMPPITVTRFMPPISITQTRPAPQIELTRTMPPITVTVTKPMPPITVTRTIDLYRPPPPSITQTPKPPTIPPPVIPILPLPNMPAGSGGILKQTAQMKGGAFTGKYKPSFAALALNITAKTAPKRTFGFEIRPIVTGKPKHQENKKLTGNYINLDDKRKTINLGRKK